MRRFLFLSLGVIAFALILSGGGCSFVCTNGSGNLVLQARNVTEFSAIDLRGSGNVYISQGVVPDLQIKTDDNLLTEITTRVHDGMLIIDRKDGSKCIKPTGEIEIWVTMPEVVGLSISGSGKMVGETTFVNKSDDLDMRISGSGEMDLDLDVPGFDMHVSGSGTLRVRGESGYANFDVSGSGKYFGFGLNSDTVKIDIAGSGKAEVGVTKKLGVDVTGNGTVYYKGNPKVNQNIAGSGSVEAVDDPAPAKVTIPTKVNTPTEIVIPEQQTEQELKDAIDKLENSKDDVPIEVACTTDSDCACGVSTMTGECFYGNNAFVDLQTKCTDFCNGIGGNLEIKCMKDTCVQVNVTQ